MQTRTEIYNNKTMYSEDFMAIYAAAKAGDKERLLQLKTEHYFMDIYDSRSLFTPAGRLAREGNHAAVKLLLQLGADPGYAAMGAASIGDNDFAEFLRRKHGACVTKIARAPACASSRITRGISCNDTRRFRTCGFWQCLPLVNVW